tara:strand:+ start:188 stop:1141 length:954 start_codon:yes stop_codon:yes gene_type:complete
MRRTSGLELLLRQKQSATLISTGDAALDAALKGGFLCGEVTELVGESSTGKTQLCHAAAASAAMVGARVVWIDATNGFSAKRLRQLVDARLARVAGGSSAGSGDASAAAAPTAASPRRDAALRRVSRCGAFTYASAMQALSGVWREQAAAQAVVHAAAKRRKRGDGDVAAEPPVADEPPVRLIVVDSITALLAPILGGDRYAQGHAAMMELGLLLVRLAEALQCAVIVTNGTVNDRAAKDAAERSVGGGSGGSSGVTTKPALGPSWASVPHARLHLALAGGARRSLVRPAARSEATLRKCSRARKRDPLLLAPALRK